MASGRAYSAAAGPIWNHGEADAGSPATPSRYQPGACTPENRAASTHRYRLLHEPRSCRASPAAATRQEPARISSQRSGGDGRDAVMISASLAAPDG